MQYIYIYFCIIVLFDDVFIFSVSYYFLAYVFSLFNLMIVRFH